MTLLEKFQALENKGDFGKILEITQGELESIEEKYYRIRALERSNRPDEALQLIYKYEGDFRQIQDDQPRIYAWYLHNLGTILFLRGDLQQAISQYQRVQQIRNEHNLVADQLLTYSNMGEIYRFMGEYDLALEYFSKAVDIIRSQIRNPSVLAFSLYSMCHIHLLRDEPKEARQQFRELEQLWSQLKEQSDRFVKYSYKFARALLLKHSRRLRDKMEALGILEEIVETLDFYSHLSYEVIISIVDLLFLEFKSLEDDEVLQDIQARITFLEKNSLDNQMYMTYLNSQLLRANVFVLDGDLTAANQILVSIGQIAEEKGLKVYLSKIQSYQDTLMQQIQMYEELLEENALLHKKIQNSELQNYINFLITKKNR